MLIAIRRYAHKGQSPLLDSWSKAFSETSPNRSMRPTDLQNVHNTVNPKDWDIAKLKRLASPGDFDICRCLFAAEVAFALQDFALGSSFAQIAHERHPNDLRAQDAVFRGRHYLRAGSPAKVGHELAGHHCSTPFNTYHLLPGGNAHLCCSVWMRTSVGNAFDSPEPSDVYNSATAQDIRRTIHDGSYSYCAKIACPNITNGLPKTDTLTRADRRTADNGQVASPPPTSINLSYDLTCNLSCPTCRSHKIAAVGAERERMLHITRTHVMPLLKTAKTVFITGSGDPFASKSFRTVLKELNPRDYPNLSVTLMTNGVLLTPNEWTTFSHLNGMIEQINISVDAATEETYAMVRRGGDFQKLLANLRFIGELRQAGAIKYFKLAFVVQQRNFREMSAFVSFASSASADEVHFQMLHDWSSMPKADFLAAAVHFPTHPEHQAFKEIMAQVETGSTGRKPFISSDFAN